MLLYRSIVCIICTLHSLDVMFMLHLYEGIYFAGKLVPTVLHYCQSYAAGDIGILKRRVPRDLFRCDAKMLVEPPLDLASSQYMIDEEGPKDTKVGKLEMLLTVIKWHKIYSILYNIILNYRSIVR